jgi:hypothetical protein
MKLFALKALKKVISLIEIDFGFRFYKRAFESQNLTQAEPLLISSLLLHLKNISQYKGLVTEYNNLIILNKPSN